MHLKAVLEKDHKNTRFFSSFYDPELVRIVFMQQNAQWIMLDYTHNYLVLVTLLTLLDVQLVLQ